MPEARPLAEQLTYEGTLDPDDEPSAPPDVERVEPSLLAAVSARDHTFSFESVDLERLASGPPPAPAPAPPRAEAPAELPGRYERLGMLGRGGMGEVWRVRDRDLNRVMALKVLRADRTPSDKVLTRFIEEAQATAQLQHPGIVPVHELGRLPDGRFYFTMKEVHGRTLSPVIDELHAEARARGAWGPTASGWTFRRLVESFHRACEAVAYAHARGVVHRDLKPSNLMVGDFGEVLVVDWGLAKVIGRPDLAAAEGRLDPVVTQRSQDNVLATRMGEVAGTPAYMPPEQARGELDRLGPPADVYALGACLYHILAGRAPFSGTLLIVLASVTAGPPPPPEGPAPLPAELVEICRRAMAPDPADRFPDAAGFARALADWLDGARRREAALAAVAHADELRPRVAEARARATALRAEAAAALAEVKPWEAVERKRPGWALQSEAAALEHTANVDEATWLQTLRGALEHEPDLPEAHDRLADHYRALHAEAEARRDEPRAIEMEVLLRAHDRGRHAAYLKGDGALTLVPDPPDATVTLFRYELQDQRLVPVLHSALGPGPVRDLPLPRGSWVAELSAPGHETVRYPFYLRRQERWDGVRPGDGQPTPIRLPRAGELGPDDVYVPAGFYWSGGDDALQQHRLPRRRIWLDAFVIRRDPVTNAEFMAFLDDLVARGREDEALAAAPRERGAGGQPGAMIYGRDADGRFTLVPDAEGDLWAPDWPVFMVDWFGATAYARWQAERSGQPWRLPEEYEWEKAARGADGRRFPWGDELDPTFCCMLSSRPEGPKPARVDEFPLDLSPYGVRGMGGNMADWCATPYLAEGAPVSSEGLILPMTDVASQTRPGRGGSWCFATQYCRVEFRQVVTRTDRTTVLGVRLVRGAAVVSASIGDRWPRPL